MRGLIVMGALVLAASLPFGPALAQETTWTHDGVVFNARTGWCQSETTQQGGPAMVVRPCGRDAPYMSATVITGAMSQQEFDAHVSSAQRAIDTQQAQNQAAQRIGGCTVSSYRVDHQPLQGVTTAFETDAQLQCEDGPHPIASLTAYARGQSGRVWLITFDHPGDPLTADDRTMLRGAVAAVQGAG